MVLFLSHRPRWPRRLSARRFRDRAAIALLVLGAWSPRTHAADVHGRVELATEYDSNPARLEVIEGEPDPGIQASPALRGQASVDAGFAAGERGRLFLSASAAGRKFTEPSARADDVGIVQASGDFAHWVGNRTGLGVQTSYYEAFQQRGPAARDFRSLSPGLRLDQGVGPGVVSIGGGYRWFVYKPEPQLDFHGPNGFLRYRHLWLSDDDDEGAGGADWELNAALSIERRDFSGPVCVQDTGCLSVDMGGTRTDHFTTVGGELVRTGEHLLGAGAAVQVNASNSFGAGLLRLALHVKGAFLLPLDLLLSFRAELLLSRYTDPLPLSRDPITGTARASIEDESRNTLRLELTRALGRRWDVGLRYLFYTNEIGTGPVAYTRHTFMLSVGVVLDPAAAVD